MMHNAQGRRDWRAAISYRHVARYGVAVGLVVVSLAIRWLLTPALGTSSPYLTSYLAVLAVAIWCGTGPAVLATFLSAVASNLFFLTPFGRLNYATAELVRLGVMLISNLGISVIGGMARSNRQKALYKAEFASRVEKELRESEQRFRALVEAAAQIVWTSDGNGNAYEDSPSWRAFTGQGLQEWRDWGWAAVVHPDDRDRMAAHWRRCLAERVPYEIEYRLRHHSGEYRWMLARAVPLLNPDGTPKGWVGMNTDITERRRAEEAAAEARRKLNSALIAGEIGTFEWDVAGERVWGDSNFARMFGISLDEHGAAPVADYVAVMHPDDQERVRKRIALTVETGVDYEIEYRVISSGTPRWLLVRARPEMDASGRVFRAAGVCLDVTKRKQAQEALREAKEAAENSLAMQRALVESMTEGVVVFDPQGNLLDMNPAGLAIHGFESVESIKRHISTLNEVFEIRDLEGRVLPVEQWPISRVLRGESFSRYEVEVRRVDGNRQWIGSYGGSRVRDTHGQVVRALVTLRDITDVKRAEKATRNSEALLNAIVDSLPVGLLIFDANGRLARMNRAASEIWGAPNAAVNLQDCEQWVGYWPETGQRLKADEWPSARAMRAGEPVTALLEIEQFGTRQHRFDLVNAAPVRDSSGNIIGGVAVQVDITERKRAEKELQESQAQLEKRTRSLKLLSDSATRLLMEDDPQQLLPELFAELASHLGLDLYFNFLVREDGQGLRLNSCGGVDDRTQRAIQHLRFGEAICGIVAQRRQRIVVQDVQQSTMPEARYLRRLGAQAYVCHPLLARERLIGTLSFGSRTRGRFSDEELELLRTLADQVAMRLERNRLMEELARRAGELAAATRSAERAKAAAEEANKAKDHFLAVLSHELRTPLAPVVAAVSMLQKQWHCDQATRDTLEMIRRNVEMEARLIDDLLDVTRITRGKIELDRRPVALCEVIRRAVEVCKPDIEARQLHFGVDIGSRAPYLIHADAARLQQVFWNLMKNAIKFTPPGGCLGIRCHQEGQSVVAEIVDSGEGIDLNLLPHIFNPFEQGGARVTRQFGGLGLGLTITKGLVEMHGGSITAHSEGKGKGATFRIRLPIHVKAESHGPAEEAVSTSDSGTSPAAGPRSLRILLVEDHGDTARIMRRLLMADGHEVRTAGDVATALELAASEPFDLLLSDLGLPDGSGVDLMRELRRRGNGLPGIALSGYGQEEDVRRSKEAGFAAHLTKPASPDRLAETIAALM